MPNTSELVAIYQHIVAHPEEWDQDNWARKTDCGTSYCFAGHAVVRAGYTPQWNLGLAWIATKDGVPAAISYAAQLVLGLDDDQADELFDEMNDLNNLRRIILDITGVDPALAEVTT